MADFDGSVSQIDVSSSDRMPVMKHRWLGIVGAALLVGTVVPTHLVAQTERGSTLAQASAFVEASADKTADKPYARIAIMRALDGHSVDWEAGYIRHLEWHREAKDTFGWYSYSVWASTERQRWIIYATFGHTAAELSNPVSPAEDERDNLINVLPHAQFQGNGIYEFLPALSRGNGVPTPALRAEYTTVDLTQGAGKAFEVALAVEQSKLRGETLWYRMVVGGETPRYVRLRPRASLAAILDERADQALPDNVNALIAKITVETLNLRPNMLVNVTPEPAR
jgi:hypothetical protein